MRIKKATRRQLREHNLQLILRAVHAGIADSRAALAQETGLAKPTVSNLIGELIDEGLLVEAGRGQSAKTGGKRPRLLEFVPVARQVIGLSISEYGLHGVLSDLNGTLQAEHILRYDDPPTQLDLNDVAGVINGLVAQLDAPLLCLGIGVPGTVEADESVTFAPHLGWQALPLVEELGDTYDVPVYIENNTALSAVAQFAFQASNQASSLASLIVNSTVEIGYVLGDTDFYSGRNLGALRPDPAGQTLDELLGWSAIKAQVAQARRAYPDTLLPERVRFLDIRYGTAQGDAASQAVHNHIEDVLAQLLAWIIALLRPDHLSIAGGVADLGDYLLARVLDRAADYIPPQTLDKIHFSLVTDPHLDALGAVAYALQQDLGIIQWQDKSA